MLRSRTNTVSLERRRRFHQSLLVVRSSAPLLFLGTPYVYEQSRPNSPFLPFSVYRTTYQVAIADYRTVKQLRHRFTQIPIDQQLLKKEPQHLYRVLVLYSIKNLISTMTSKKSFIIDFYRNTAYSTEQTTASRLYAPEARTREINTPYIKPSTSDNLRFPLHILHVSLSLGLLHHR